MPTPIPDASVELQPVDAARDRALVAGWLAQPDVRRWCADRRAEGLRLVGLAAATANAAALAAYAKAGFAPYRDFAENGEGYRYLTRDLHMGV